MRVWGDPVDYKGIKIYPVEMKNINEFYDHIYCLMYEKNRVPDIRVIKMPYLDYLFLLMQHDEQIIDSLRKILKLVFGDQEFKFEWTENEPISISIGSIQFSGYEFENLRNIILKDNGLKIEEILDPEMEKEMHRLEEYKAKENGVPATLEERIVTLHCLSGVTFQDIKKYTLFQFNQTLQRFAIIKNFEVYTHLMAENGLSKDIVHFLSHIEEKSRLDNLTMSKEEFNKVTSIGKSE